MVCACALAGELEEVPVGSFAEGSVPGVHSSEVAAANAAVAVPHSQLPRCDVWLEVVAVLGLKGSEMPSSRLPEGFQTPEPLEASSLIADVSRRFPCCPLCCSLGARRSTLSTSFNSQPMTVCKERPRLSDDMLISNSAPDQVQDEAEGPPLDTASAAVSAVVSAESAVSAHKHKPSGLTPQEVDLLSAVESWKPSSAVVKQWQPPGAAAQQQQQHRILVERARGLARQPTEALPLPAVRPRQLRAQLASQLTLPLPDRLLGELADTPEVTMDAVAAAAVALIAGNHAASDHAAPAGKAAAADAAALEHALHMAATTAMRGGSRSSLDLPSPGRGASRSSLDLPSPGRQGRGGAKTPEGLGRWDSSRAEGSQGSGLGRAGSSVLRKGSSSGSSIPGEALQRGGGGGWFPEGRNLLAYCLLLACSVRCGALQTLPLLASSATRATHACEEEAWLTYYQMPYIALAALPLLLQSP